MFKTCAVSYPQNLNTFRLTSCDRQSLVARAIGLVLFDSTHFDFMSVRFFSRTPPLWNLASETLCSAQCPLDRRGGGLFLLVPETKRVLGPVHPHCPFNGHGSRRIFTGGFGTSLLPEVDLRVLRIEQRLKKDPNKLFKTKGHEGQLRGIYRALASTKAPSLLAQLVPSRKWRLLQRPGLVMKAMAENDLLVCLCPHDTSVENCQPKWPRGANFPVPFIEGHHLASTPPLPPTTSSECQRPFV